MRVGGRLKGRKPQPGRGQQWVVRMLAHLQLLLRLVSMNALGSECSLCRLVPLEWQQRGRASEGADRTWGLGDRGNNSSTPSWLGFFKPDMKWKRHQFDFILPVRGDFTPGCPGAGVQAGLAPRHAGESCLSAVTGWRPWSSSALATGPCWAFSASSLSFQRLITCFRVVPNTQQARLSQVLCRLWKITSDSWVLVLRVCWWRLDKDSFGLIKPVLLTHVLLEAEKHRLPSFVIF